MIDIHKLHSTNTPLDNRYLLKNRIGGGGFSEVWLASDLKSQVDVVLKIYASSQSLDEEGIRMFRKEFAIVCNLNHTNILKPFTFDIYQGSPYIVLPYCEKGSASRYVGRISEEQLWDFAGQVAAGLNHLHKHNIIHQDIKPANVLINKDNQFMITDFGISTGLRNTIRNTRGTDDYEGSGTTAYMSYECLGPEQSNVMARDIWAFGATLYELATGNVPFGELGGITQNSGVCIPKIQKSFSKDIENLIHKCLSLKAWNRPSAEEIVKLVEDHRQGRKIHPPFKRKRAVIWSVCAAAAVVCIYLLLKPSPSPLPSPTPDPDNPNDKIALAQIDSAILMVEAETGNSADKRNVEILSAAANIFNEAIGLELTDSVADIGRKRWSDSQSVIDETYRALSNKALYYYEGEADEAANGINDKCKQLEKFVTDSVKNI